jgi:hypothetical protein
MPKPTKTTKTTKSAKSAKGNKTTKRTAGGRPSNRKAAAAAAAAKRRRAAQLSRLAIAACLAIVVVGIGLLIASRSHDPGSKIAGLKKYSNLARGHVETPVSYNVTPPVGGDHSASPQPCGAYSEPIANERGVHSMEHGAVWITYQPQLAAAEVDRLAALADKKYVLVSPYPNLPSPVVASAWGRQVALTSAGDPRLQAFLDAYRDGPQAPEPGSAC